MFRWLDRHEGVAFFLVVTVMVLAIFGLAFLFAVQEAKSYNKFCDKPVTPWDALWLDLRIDECD